MSKPKLTLDKQSLARLKDAQAHAITGGSDSPYESTVKTISPEAGFNQELEATSPTISGDSCCSKSCRR